MSEQRDNKQKLKAGYIVPYFYDAEIKSYRYLLGLEAKHKCLNPFGGKIEVEDGGDIWVTASREFGEEFWGLRGTELKTFVDKMINNPPPKVEYFLKSLKVVYIFCSLEPILQMLDEPNLTVENVISNFLPNTEMSALFWVLGKELWEECFRAKGKSIFGKNADDYFVRIYPDRHFKVQLRPGCVEMGLEIAMRKLYLKWETEGRPIERKPGWKITKDTT